MVFMDEVIDKKLNYIYLWKYMKYLLNNCKLILKYIYN